MRYPKRVPHIFMKSCLSGIINGGNMEIPEAIRSIINELAGTEIESIAPDTDISEILSDPFDREELILDVENMFDVLIPESDVHTVGDLMRLAVVA